MFDVLLRNASLVDGSKNIDLAIQDGRVIQKGANLNTTTRRLIDLQGRLVVPGFVESHIHLDLALMNDAECPGRPAPFYSPTELNSAMELRRRQFTHEDIVQRASQAIEMASRHGVTALRAQCHVDQEVGLKHIKALLEAGEKYQDRVTLQIVAFPQQGLLDQPETLELIREAFRLGASVMGCASNLDPAVRTNADVQRHIDLAFSMAMQAGVDLDVHADLGIPGVITLNELEVVHLARRTIEYGYQGRVTAGHVSALDSARLEVAEQAINLIKQAQINVVSQPDLFRLGRQDTRNVRRGLTRVKQLLAAGVNVTFASNNVRDALRPMGNFDLLEEGLILAYGAHMDSVAELEMLIQMCTENAARALRLEGYGIKEGCKADLVVLNAKSPSDALVSQAEKLFVFKNGILKAANWQKNELY